MGMSADLLLANQNALLLKTTKIVAVEIFNACIHVVGFMKIWTFQAKNISPAW